MAPRGLSTLLEVRFFASGLESAAAQPSKFLTANGHEWTRINPDKAGETASCKVRPYNHTNRLLLSHLWARPRVEPFRRSGTKEGSASGVGARSRAI